MERRDRVDVDDREAALGEALQHVAPAALALGLAACGTRPASARSRTFSMPPSPPSGSAPRRTIFMPLYCFGLCEAVTIEAALVAVLADGEVQHLGADEADLVDVAAGVERGLDGRLAELGRRQPHVAADRHRARLELVDVGAHDAVHAVGVQLVRDDAADVVGLEDRGIERHGRNARSATGRDERRTRLGQVLRHHAHVGEHGHEVVVAGPARDDVQVQVIGDAGARGRAEVEADVVALRAERRCRCAWSESVEQLPHLGPLALRRDRRATRRAGTARP